MNYHQLDQEKIEDVLQTSAQHGLSEKEVTKRRKQYGFNELEDGEKQSTVLLFFSQFKDFMVLVLLAATLISGLLGEYIDAIAIMAIVLLNGFLGFYQERKAEKSLHALKELSAPQVTVLRDGEWIRILSREVVVGDIVKFTSGDRIGADVRLVQTTSLEIEESALTGESVPVTKTTGVLHEESPSLGDLTNMAFMGTLVTRGSGVGVVVGTGMKTAMGQIADLIQKAEQMITPLQRKLEQLGKILIAAALGLTVLVVLVGVLQGHDVYTMFFTGVSLAVAAIPEGLPAIVTVALSLGVHRMIRKNAIVRKLPAVETLGCASVICSDKTGTMTENKMTVTTLWTNDHLYGVTGNGYEPQGVFTNQDTGVNILPKEDRALHQLLTFGLLCNHADLKEGDTGYVLDGDPTEGALLVAALKAGLSRQGILDQFEIIDEIPFDSERKMMTVIVEDENRKRFAVTKGAPDIVIERCDAILSKGKRQYFSEDYRKKVQQSIVSMNQQALRTIAIAYKPLDAGYRVGAVDELEKELQFIGLQGMIDPPRKEVRQAVKECKAAGIKTVMITGDHVITAKAIATDLGILEPQHRVLEGVQLNKMSLEELEEVVDETTVFARVSPEHKLKIVKALQNRGHIVAMTGDGVNDAPAIKTADIGVAMGITGTDVSKEASSLVLLDDNFATIKSAIHEGRNIYENIRKFIRYLLASNVGEILVMLFAMLMALPLPLVPIQILWVNLVTDGLPAMALGLDKPEDDVMNRKPRHPKEGVFARGLGWKVLSRGFLIGLATLAAFLITYQGNEANLVYAQTVAFATLVMAQLIHVFDCRSDRSVFARNPFGNKYLVWAVLISLVMMLVVIYFPPLQPIFHTVPIRLTDWLFIVGFAAIPTFVWIGSLFARRS
ncbi:calcium-translocating P-type ATPase, SERCA-type [Bacillus fonticola]|uniref:calcium-translocating P-type ATPase, SERCA-type n=1 Tax=Bacillus fonticola TaxID=2728853 RepID=UPI00147332D0|nr:calcium-translocating P-type ATPase, SERCA-type [Bacillus fonticola]